MEDSKFYKLLTEIYNRDDDTRDIRQVAFVYVASREKNKPPYKIGFVNSHLEKRLHDHRTMLMNYYVYMVIGFKDMKFGLRNNASTAESFFHRELKQYRLKFPKYEKGTVTMNAGTYSEMFGAPLYEIEKIIPKLLEKGKGFHPTFGYKVSGSRLQPIKEIREFALNVDIPTTHSSRGRKLSQSRAGDVVPMKSARGGVHWIQRDTLEPEPRQLQQSQSRRTIIGMQVMKNKIRGTVVNYDKSTNKYEVQWSRNTRSMGNQFTRDDILEMEPVSV